MQRSAVRRLVLLGAPLSLAVWMLLHPWPYDDYRGELLPMADWWTALHVVQFLLFPLAGAAAWLLTDGLRGPDVIVSRLGAVVFVVFYEVGDAVAGISTGILARAAAGAPPGRQDSLLKAIEALFADPIKNAAFEIGIYAWVVTLAAAAVALFRAGAPRPPLLLLAPAAYFMVGDHARPFGSLVFGSFFLAALWLELGWRKRARGVA